MQSNVDDRFVTRERSEATAIEKHPLQYRIGGDEVLAQRHSPDARLAESHGILAPCADDS